MIEQSKKNLATGIAIKLSLGLNEVWTKRKMEEHRQRGEVSKTIFHGIDNREVKSIQQWSHKDLMEFLKRKYPSITEMFLHTGYTGADMVHLDFQKFAIINDTHIRNQLIGDIQARKDKSPISVSSELESPGQELGEGLCDDAEEFSQSAEMLEYNVILAENFVSGKALAPLTDNNLNELGFNTHEDRELLLGSPYNWSEGSGGSSSIIGTGISGVSPLGFIAEYPECELLERRGQVVTTSSNTSSRASTSNESLLSNEKGEEFSVNASHVWNCSDNSPVYTNRIEADDSTVMQVSKPNSSDVKSRESQCPDMSERKSVKILIPGSSRNSIRTSYLPSHLAEDLSNDRIRSKYLKVKIPAPKNTFVELRRPLAHSLVQFGSDLPNGPRDWSVDQVLKYLGMRVSPRTMEILRHERMDGVEFLGTSNRKLEDLIPDTIEQEKLKSVLLYMQDAVDCIDTVFPTKSRNSETIPVQWLREQNASMKPRSWLHFPMPQFWNAEQVSEWLQNLDGGIYAKYIPKVKRLGVTGKQLLTDQMSFFGRIGLRKPNELSKVRNHISNLTNNFKPVEIRPANWAREHTQEFFRTHPDWDIAQYSEVFGSYQVNGQDLLAFTRKRLIDIGITNVSHQRKILLLKKSLNFSVGEKVLFRGMYVKVKWIGFPRLPHHAGEWIGIELKSTDAKKMRAVEKSKFHDGSVRRQRYFTAKIGCGLLVRRAEIRMRTRRNASV